MLIADTTYIAVDPTWPFDLPWLGMPGLALIAGLLVALTIWTYLGAGKITRSQLCVILFLRLAALVVVCMLVLRPSLARQEDEVILPSKLLFLVDSSESMNLKDEFSGLSRWDNARRILADPMVKSALNDLALKSKVEVVYYQGAEGIARFDFDRASVAKGRRTDVGAWLHELWQQHGRESNLRGLVIFSDGADNGTRYLPLKEAARWPGICPIHTFPLGKSVTTLDQRDIALVAIQTPTLPVPVKTQFTVRGTVSAPGFENSLVVLSLWIEDPSTGTMKIAGRKERIVLKKSHGNEVALTRDAPRLAGEYKVTLKVEPLPGEVTELNNEISSYITATKEGVSILWVEGRKRLESTFAIRHALGRDPRFRLYPAEKLGDVDPEQEDWFNFDKQHYDVIVIGDISAERFSSGRREVFSKIKHAITKEGTGLLLMGGQESLNNKDWDRSLASDLLALLPVTLDAPKQVEGPVRMLPTPGGLHHFLLKLADDPEKNREIWEKTFEPLDGMTRIGTPKPTAVVLATVASRERERPEEPILVGTQEGEGRILVFGGDTTWKAWRRSPEMLPAYERFWKQTMLWLARQEKVEGAAWIKLDTRRVPANGGEAMGFSVGLRGKEGVPIKNATFQASVLGPGKEEFDVPIVPESDDHRGYFLKTGVPGEYRVELEAKVKDVKGKEKASARFLVVDEDLESLRPAADLDFLADLARIGGGKMHQADEVKLAQFLKEIGPLKQALPRVQLWPEWRSNPPANPGQSPSAGDQLGTLWSTAALPCLVLFVSFISVEWFLRRRWGLV